MNIESNLKREKITLSIFQKRYILPKYILHPSIFIFELLANMLMFTLTFDYSV